MVLLILACDKPDDKKDDPPEFVDGWTLVWQDEFEGDGPVDSTKWEQPEYNRKNNDNGPDGWWLKEDSYLDGEGNLAIRARRIDNLNFDGDAYDYSTGAVRSINRFEQTFGRFEARVKLPSQAGWWVAFWLMSPTVFNEDGSGQDGTEIDIMEGFGWTNKIFHALHWDGYGAAHRSESINMELPGIRDGFHTFTLEWNSAEYIFFVDSVETWRSSAGGVSQVPAYIKLTGELSTTPGAIGDWWANDPEFVYFPDYYLIDYVRVWIED